MTAQNTQEHSRWNRIVHFFPFQLLLLHLKHNHFFLVLWAVVFSFTVQVSGQKYGVPSLLLFPEYLNNVDFLSFMILGFSLGGFIMAFNIYSYMMYGFKFPFIATVSRPFVKFCVNNFIIPLLFVLVYITQSYLFQIEYELIDKKEAFTNLVGFGTGLLVFFTLSFYYFFRTNKDISKLQVRHETLFRKLLRLLKNKRRKQAEEGPSVETTFRAKRTAEPVSFKYGWYVSTYLLPNLRIRIARTPEHYNEETLRRVFTQNHINASFYEIGLLISFILIGSMRDREAFAIPAGASIFLLFTMIVMIYSILFSYFRWWTPSIAIGLMLLFNFLTVHIDWLKMDNQAYGLNYTVQPAEYTQANINSITAADTVQQDVNLEYIALNNWKDSLPVFKHKPLLIIINSSGGGLRSTIWTFRVMQVLDSISNGEILKYTRLMTGSSGGMMGQAYFRELYRQRQKGQNIQLNSGLYLTELGRDILNPVALSIATTDMFIRYQSFKDGEYTYVKDRAYAFEKQYNKNTLNFLTDLRLKDYRQDEANGRIPMMVFTPTIINDGRRLVISSQPVSYLCADKVRSSMFVPNVENIEFRRLFKDQDADNLKFTTAIRMSATFPYVMPMVSLPSTPKVEVMDAGLRDNMGLKLSMQYIYAMKDWLNENTRGVLIIRIRDSQKDGETDEGSGSLLYRLSGPFGSLYGNFITTQEFDTDQMFQYLDPLMDVPVNMAEISLSKTDRPISLSWHLTNLEKREILNSVYSVKNQESYQKIKTLLTQ
jgi:hypothetical protein